MATIIIATQNNSGFNNTDVLFSFVSTSREPGLMQGSRVPPSHYKGVALALMVPSGGQSSSCYSCVPGSRMEGRGEEGLERMLVIFKVS